MRFAAPSRSPSPPPLRSRPGQRKKNHAPTTLQTSSFGLRHLSDSEESPLDSDVESSSSDSFCYASESEVPPRLPNLNRIKRTPAEQREINETLASIRLRTQYNDPLEEWERTTRKEAFRIAYDRTRRSKSSLVALYMTAAKLTSEKLHANHTEQMEQVQSILASLQLKHRAEDEKLHAEWAERDRKLWAGIEEVIAKEERRVQDAKAREEAEAKRIQEQKEQEQRRLREAEEKRRQELAEQELKQQLLRQKKAREEREEKEAAAEAARMQQELQRSETERKAAGLTTADEEWTEARAALNVLKGETMKAVKGHSDMKKEWGKCRRQITPKVGQVTNSASEIARISEQLYAIAHPQSPYAEPLYSGVLSALAKAFLLQAETEVVAKSSTSLPLAKVAVNMLAKLPQFHIVFWAKLVQRTGGWALAKFIKNDPNLSEEDNQKLIGARRNETSQEYRTRVTGLMTFYFAILATPTSEPLPPQFRPARIWIYLSRLLSSPALLKDPIAPSLITSLLDVGGEVAIRKWGRQWVKMLFTLAEAIKKDVAFGGSEVEGKAGRVRVFIELERMFQLAGISPP